ncbi:cation-translocating P-type ATPase [Brevibacillus dissolubilis]|uniref:cation-translocating P-type ATPase n=1 Tax=Brevibacillus dissolubilis TaxID=1844116 RepID=UPI0021001358|nr:HAD-IC family P-type ATPase [Brevibacillus dissolubilis]
MEAFTFKQRAIHALPGRLRVEVYGIKGDRSRAGQLTQSLSSQPGITSVRVCDGTGKALIHYQPEQLTAEMICQFIQRFEEQVFVERHSQLEAGEESRRNVEIKSDREGDTPLAEQQIAATAYAAAVDERGIPPAFEAVPHEPIQRQEGLPLTLTAVAVAGVGVLGVKQLLAGKSALAANSGLFAAAGVLSIVSGYPMLKQGAERLFREGQISTDLVLGAAAVALGLVRENLLALSGAALIQFLQWQRLKNQEKNMDPALYQATETKRYANRASTLGFGLAGATYLYTRNPWMTLGILLAANPRPALAAEEYAWKQAEHVSREGGRMLPRHMTLCQLSELKQVIVDDTSTLFTKQEGGLTCISKQDEEHAWGLVRNLLEETNHPLRQAVLTHTVSMRMKKRQTFQLQHTQDGVRANIGGHDVLFGNKAWMQANQISLQDYEWEAKRHEKKGCEVYYLAKDRKCRALFTNKCPVTEQAEVQHLAALQEAYPGIRVSFLQDSLGIARDGLVERPQWRLLTNSELDRLSATKHSEAQHHLLIRKNSPPSALEAEVPFIYASELSQLSKTIEYAHKVGQLNTQHRKFTAMWNVIATPLVMMGRISPPLTNLIADGVKLIFLSRAERAVRSREAGAEPDFFGWKLGGWGEKRDQPSGVESAGDFATPQRNSDSEQTDTEQTDIGSISTKIGSSQTTTDTPSFTGRTGATAWHSLSEHELSAQLNTSTQQGLTAGQVKQLHAKVGPNVIQPAKKQHWSMVFLKQFSEFTTLILLGTATLSILSGDIFDGLAMGAVLVANAVIATVQERKAERIVEALDQFQPPQCRVIRDGKQIEVSATDLVPGDLVVMEAGDCVPADLRLIEDNSLEVNEAALTGESFSVKKQTGVTSAKAALAERSNMLYMGTSITRGKGIGVVVATGMTTEIGYLTSLLKDDELEMTPLQQKATAISKFFVKGAMAVGTVVFAVGLLRGNTIGQMISTSVALIASAIPEGLPVTITIALSAGIFRMSKRNAVMRKLSSLETLGRVTVICSDKTGTLTKNEMTVTKIATIDDEWDVSGEGYAPVGTMSHPNGKTVQDSKELKKLIHIAMLCNDSQLTQRDNNWSLKGDPTEGALLTLAKKAGYHPEKLTDWSRKNEIPFDSNHGTMSVICHDGVESNPCFLMTKGSIEAVLNKCNSYQSGGEVHPLTDQMKQTIITQNKAYASQALRVLGFAYRCLKKDEGTDQVHDQDLIYIGMVGMIDPAKPEVDKAIQEAFQLGVKPVMITGDHPITAIAIGQRLGMYQPGDRVVTGVELDGISDDELVKSVNHISIFARVTPEHKLRIVQAYQRAGHIVAMTGDGVNDAPAIKKANVGIAMGRTGTEVTKQSADMVLKEDHFGSIVDGVKEGRTIISNIRKAIGCLLTGNLAEIMVSSLAVIAGLPIPLVPVQILLMNLLTDALPAAVLAVNPGNKELVTERQDIVDRELYKKVAIRGLILGLGALGLFAASMAAGTPLPVARTMAFATLVAGQLIQTFSWRQENGQPFNNWVKDRFMLGALGVSWLALMAVIYIPALSTLFHTAPLSLTQMIPVLLVGGSVSLVSRPLVAAITGRQAPTTAFAPIQAQIA